MRGPIQQLIKDGISDFSSFSDPDVQYVLLNAQKDYARFGTEEMLETLGTLISKRVKYNDDFYLKVIIDKALAIANMLSLQHLNLLSLLFICKHTSISDIHTIDDLDNHFKYICDVFSPVDAHSMSFLNDMGCLKLNLSDIPEKYAKMCHIEKSMVEEILPQIIRDIDGDYGLSYVGIILAITNAENQSNFICDPKIWIHG